MKFYDVMNKNQGKYTKDDHTFKLKDMHFSKEQILGEHGLIVCTGVHPIYKYSDGKQTSEVIGCQYSCFAPDKHNKSFKLKVYGEEPVLTEEQFKTNLIVKLEVDDFKGKFYVWKNREYFTAIGKGVHVKCVE